MATDAAQAELIRRISSIVGHELRNPLAALNNSASVTAATGVFAWLQFFTEEAETSLDANGNFRRYTRTFPLRALSV
mgnify:CR=1 FL=1